MKGNEFLDKMELIDPAYVEAADTKQKKKKNIWVKWGAMAACLALVFIASFGTALAVNADFRAKVFEFLHITQAEEVPKFQGNNDENMDAAISDSIHAYYLKLDDNYVWDVAQNGLLYRRSRTDDSEFGICSIEGDLVQELTCQETEFEYIWNGNKYFGSVIWAEANGIITAYGNGSQPANDQSWYIGPSVSDGKEVILYLSSGRQVEYTVYPTLLDLQSGEVRPIFDGIDMSEVGLLHDVSYSENLQYAVLWGMDIDTQKVKPYFCDRETGSVTSLSELVNTEISDGAHFVGNTLLMLSIDDTGNATCWTYDPRNSTTAKTVDHMPCDNPAKGIRGLCLLGGQYALVTGGDDTLSVIDLLTGDTSDPVEGFVYDDSMTFNMNAAGNKALYFKGEQDVQGLGISQLGAIDFETARFILFDRAGFEQNYEWSVFWLNDTRVCIRVGGDSGRMCIYDFGDVG